MWSFFINHKEIKLFTYELIVPQTILPHNLWNHYRFTSRTVPCIVKESVSFHSSILFEKYGLLPGATAIVT